MQKAKRVSRVLAGLLVVLCFAVGAMLGNIAVPSVAEALPQCEICDGGCDWSALQCYCEEEQGSCTTVCSEGWCPN
jgi:hypothetical protein